MVAKVIFFTTFFKASEILSFWVAMMDIIIILIIERSGSINDNCLMYWIEEGKKLTTNGIAIQRKMNNMFKYLITAYKMNSKA